MRAEAGAAGEAQVVTGVRKVAVEVEDMVYQVLGGQMAVMEASRQVAVAGKT